MTTTKQLKQFIEDGSIMSVPLYAVRNDCTPPTARKRLKDWHIIRVYSNMELFIEDEKICEWFVGNMKCGIITTIKKYAEENGLTSEAARVRLTDWDEVEIGNKRYLYIRKEE